MAFTARTGIVIDRPVEEVWAYIDDPSHDVYWRPVKNLKRTGSGVGARYEGVVGVGPKDYPYVSEITDYEPPTRLAWKGISSAGWMIGSEGSYTLEQVGGGTRWTIELKLEPNTFLGRVVEPLGRAMGSRAFGSIPKRLKEAVERQPR